MPSFVDIYEQRGPDHQGEAKSTRQVMFCGGHWVDLLIISVAHWLAGW